jgi:hypothetical protein
VCPAVLPHGKTGELTEGRPLAPPLGGWWTGRAAPLHSGKAGAGRALRSYQDPVIGEDSVSLLRTTEHAGAWAKGDGVGMGTQKQAEASGLSPSLKQPFICSALERDKSLVGAGGLEGQQ